MNEFKQVNWEQILTNFIKKFNPQIINKNSKSLSPNNFPQTKFKLSKNILVVKLMEYFDTI